MALNKKQGWSRVYAQALLASAFACNFSAFLSAEENGVFLGGGFQYSHLAGKDNYSQPLLHFVRNGVVYGQAGYDQPGKISSNLYGGDVQIGYKQFFGESKIFGLRYYGFFSGQTGNATFSFSAVPSQGIAASSVVARAVDLFYGAGIDMLFNFYKSADHAFGLFVGAMVGGSSWMIGKAYNTSGHYCATPSNGQCISVNDYYAQSAKSAKQSGDYAKFSPTSLQVIVNVGLRLNFTRHQGLEAGVRIPTIEAPYYIERNVLMQGKDAYTIALKRAVVAFANYVISF
ncbi:outer membrane protein [Helicobacter baculiformis]|uniref:Outer membrane protein n=1 Tax=Helicobacter baculiformis TaxID=427351 RepID=A0ABV7ZJW8_9HELI|nr:outer membrane protein [Helicobacter baculiformis]